MSLPLWLPRPYDIALAFGLLTRLPIHVDMDRAKQRAGHMAWAYAVVGAALGGLAAATGIFALQIGLQPIIAATIATAMITFITGAMHEDGFADVCDGFWGGWDKTRRIEIMKDSHIGVYGTYGLICIFGLRVFAIAALLPAAPWALVGIFALSRAGMVAITAALPNARGGGLSHSVGASKWPTAMIAMGLGIVAHAITAPPFAAVGCVLAFAGVAFIAKWKIEGQTGDVLGASQVAAEVAGLITATAFIS